MTGAEAPLADAALAQERVRDERADVVRHAGPVDHGVDVEVALHREAHVAGMRTPAQRSIAMRRASSMRSPARTRAVEGHAPGVEAGGVEEVVDEAEEVGAAAGDGLQALALPLAHLPVDP